MRLVVSALFALSITPAIFAQGLVNFANTANTLVYAQAPYYNGPVSVMSGPPGSYYFGLFFGGGPFLNPTFTGIYATNTGVNGLFNGGVVAVPGWGAGTSRDYFVAGWSASVGHDFQPTWFIDISTIPAEDFGWSHTGTGTAGDGTSIPVLNLFDGGGNTITSGFTLVTRLVPEPSTASMIVLGAGVILSYRVRWRKASEAAAKTNESVV
jgi:hypothetical protein